MAQQAWMDEQPLEILENVEQDNAWVKCRSLANVGQTKPLNASLVLPEGSVITATNGHGASYWSRTARIDVRLPSDTEEAYFLMVVL
jgi:hypothetical protein